jgi:ligand-binding sensor domain-containing protein
MIILQNRLVAQDLVSYSSSATMVHDHINCIYHDPDGYVWIGTRDGLSRFDGHTFVVYRNAPDDSTTIPDNQINRITEDKSGNIWIIANAGIARYQRNKDNFQRITFHPGTRQVYQNSCDICFDSTGYGWLINNKELISFYLEGTAKRFVDISDFHFNSGNLVSDDRGLWIPSWKGLFHFSFQKLRTQARLTVEDADSSYRFPVEKTNMHGVAIIHTSSGEFMLNVMNMKPVLQNYL